jgi:uncharacterized membrane protein YqjE
MSRLYVTYVVVGVCAVLGLAGFISLILVPVWGTYQRTWERAVATVLSFYVLAAMMGLGLAGAIGFYWIWERLQ